ncbi:flavodoxin [Maribacter polysiphoniae]|nr:flavodoxin [Maribacter polysiphoniae]PWK24355.1 flavodoxin I [Maribacter polysiphoniae]
MKIGLFYGSDTGNTEEVANKIAKIIGEEYVDVHSIGKVSNADLEMYDHLIFGTSTWYDGELQSEWEDFLPNLDEIDFSGKTVALFGLGDQLTYGEYFIDGVGIIYDKIIERGAKVVGHWPIDDYDFEESVAEREGNFVGLALDDDNEYQKTDGRIKKWADQLSTAFRFTVSI